MPEAPPATPNEAGPSSPASREEGRSFLAKDAKRLDGHGLNRGQYLARPLEGPRDHRQ